MEIERDAAEFGVHARSGGWRLGLLVARCVVKGHNNGGNLHDRGGSEEGKVSIVGFARKVRAF